MEVNKIIQGDCLEVMKTFPDNHFDAIVTDPPAGISFMGKAWDHDKGGRDKWIEWMQTVAAECLRVIKPGGHALVWSIPRTSHWTATAWENGGFECRDRISHIFGSGFPKSSDISKNIDKMCGIDRDDKFEGLGRNIGPSGNKRCDICGKWLVSGSPCTCPRPQDEPQSDEAKKWYGWGTALKPAVEDWWVFRKQISEKTIAENVLKWGVGGLNIDACRVAHNEPVKNTTRNARKITSVWTDNACGFDNTKNNVASADPKGRFPANLVLDKQSALLLDEQTGILKSGDGPCIRTKEGFFLEHGGNGKPGDVQIVYGDEGGASRFFYCAKASRSERNLGLEEMPEKEVPYSEYRDNFKDTKSYVTQYPDGSPRPVNKTKNSHTTVKSINLMRYLCRLVTPKNGLILDPFAGSGSTCIAAVLEGFQYVGIEKETEYIEIANKRIEYWTRKCWK